MMGTHPGYYCFAERRWDLFADMFLRGFIQLVWDGPQDYKDHWQREDTAKALAESMREDTCCVLEEDESAYRRIVMSGFIYGYESMPWRRFTERCVVGLKLIYREMTPSEARMHIRDALHTKGGSKYIIDEAYERLKKRETE